MTTMMNPMAPSAAPAGVGGVMRHTCRVPMRDGVHLATDVYLPAGHTGHTGPLPVLLERTPYGLSLIHI